MADECRHHCHPRILAMLPCLSFDTPGLGKQQLFSKRKPATVCDSKIISKIRDKKMVETGSQKAE